MTSIAIINKSPAHGTGAPQESLDLALAAGSFGQNVALFFIDDGVFQLLKEQNTDAINKRNYSKTFSALEFYDIEDIYVCQQSLSERGLKHSDLCIEVGILDTDELRQQLATFNHILSF